MLIQYIRTGQNYENRNILSEETKADNLLYYNMNSELIQTLFCLFLREDICVNIYVKYFFLSVFDVNMSYLLWSFLNEYLIFLPVVA